MIDMKQFVRKAIASVILDEAFNDFDGSDDFEEQEHPRYPKGHPEGGKFRKKGWKEPKGQEGRWWKTSSGYEMYLPREMPLSDIVEMWKHMKKVTKEGKMSKQDFGEIMNELKTYGWDIDDWEKWDSLHGVSEKKEIVPQEEEDMFDRIRKELPYDEMEEQIASGEGLSDEKMISALNAFEMNWVKDVVEEAGLIPGKMPETKSERDALVAVYRKIIEEAEDFDIDIKGGNNTVYSKQMFRDMYPDVDWDTIDDLYS